MIGKSILLLLVISFNRGNDGIAYDLLVLRRKLVRVQSAQDITDGALDGADIIHVFTPSPYITFYHGRGSERDEQGVIEMTEERLKQLLAEVVAQATIQPELLKLKDVATMLSLSPPSVLRLVDAGKIPFVLYGRTRMYRRRDVMAYIESMETHKGRNTNGVA